MNCKAVELCGVEPYDCMVISGELAFSLSNVTVVLSNDTLLEIMQRRDRLQFTETFKGTSKGFETVFHHSMP